MQLIIKFSKFLVSKRFSCSDSALLIHIYWELNLEEVDGPRFTQLSILVHSVYGLVSAAWSHAWSISISIDSYILLEIDKEVGIVDVA